LDFELRKLTFKDNRAFGVTDLRGEIPRSHPSELGLYFNDTRHLNTWESLVNGHAPVPLAQELRHGGSTWVISMTNQELPGLAEGTGRIDRDSLLIRRILCLHEDALFEILTLRNFSARTQVLQIESWSGAQFEDLFEVRGMTRRSRGHLLAPEERMDGGTVHTLSYKGLDSRIRRTHVRRIHPFEKIRLSPSLSGAFSRHELASKEILTLRTQVSFSCDSPGSHAARATFYGEPFESLDAGDLMRLAGERRRSRLLFDLKIETDNAILDRAIESAATDLEMLITVEDDRHFYPYAGIPWFSAPFGRDGLISAYQLLPWCPELARGVLDFVFEHLGSKIEPFTEEEPGKAFHELRRGEMAALREIPFIPYYGSVDATPLALILLHEYLCWTMDTERLEQWWPNAIRALDWLDHSADPGSTGFVGYSRKSPTGLFNQGWKDSGDSVMHSDGRIAEHPIHLCEAQAYAHRARLGMSELAALQGQDALALRLKRQAQLLKARFDAHFWDPARQYVYLALDGRLSPCEVMSSNMGHCLWGGIVSPMQARFIARHLLAEPLFSGHGVRTLSDSEKAYNPLSYHNGSIWPHDNSLIAEGLRNYGQEDALERLALGLFGVLESSDDFRLPELFCGFRKRGREPPIPYQVACKPQAWAAGSIFLLLKSLLGLSMPLFQTHLTLRSPLLTSKVSSIVLRGLKIRDSEMDLRFYRSAGSTYVKSERKKGSIRLLTVRRRAAGMLD
jgi:glycogen debranching enzyme